MNPYHALKVLEQELKKLEHDRDILSKSGQKLPDYELAKIRSLKDSIGVLENKSCQT